MREKIVLTLGVLGR